MSKSYAQGGGANQYRGSLDMLNEIGCDDIQGYYISRPLPAEEFKTSYLEKKQRLIIVDD